MLKNCSTPEKSGSKSGCQSLIKCCGIMVLYYGSYAMFNFAPYYFFLLKYANSL